MTVYRVKVEVHVLVEARDMMAAKAKGEMAVRRAVIHWYRHDESGNNFADNWEGFSFRAKKAERWESGADDDGA